MNKIITNDSVNDRYETVMGFLVHVYGVDIRHLNKLYNQLIDENTRLSEPENDDIELKIEAVLTLLAEQEDSVEGVLFRFYPDGDEAVKEWQEIAERDKAETEEFNKIIDYEIAATQEMYEGR